MNYDQDIANAREEAAMQARNEKFANKVKSFDDGNKIPPSFSQNGGQSVAQKQKKKSMSMDFSDMKKWGY
jgi:hypothetical protein